MLGLGELGDSEDSYFRDSTVMEYNNVITTVRAVCYSEPRFNSRYTRLTHSGSTFFVYILKVGPIATIRAIVHSLVIDLALTAYSSNYGQVYSLSML